MKSLFDVKYFYEMNREKKQSSKDKTYFSHIGNYFSQTVNRCVKVCPPKKKQLKFSINNALTNFVSTNRSI